MRYILYIQSKMNKAPPKEEGWGGRSGGARRPDGNGAPGRFGVLCGVRVRLAANAFGNDSRAPPCTRKGHRPLTPGRRKTCVLLVMGPEAAYAAQPPDVGKSANLTVCFCRGGRFRLAAGMPLGNSLRAPPCTRKGQRPLTWVGAKLVFCLLWGRIAPAGDCPAEIGRENGRKPLKNVDLTGANIV